MKCKFIVVIGSISCIIVLLVGVILLFSPQIPFGLAVGYDVAVQGDYAYVSDNEGVNIFNINNPNNPIRIKEVRSPDGAFGICIEGNYLFIASDSDGFEIVNISNPENPTVLGTYNDGGSIYDVDVNGGVAYTLDLQLGLEILNITYPEQITKIGTYSDGGEYTSILVRQNIGYIANPQVGLKVFNFTDPTSPSKLQTVSNTRGVRDLCIYESLLFLGCHANGVKIYNISNPISPQPLGSFIKSGGEVYGTTGNHTHLYVADLLLGTYVLNITDPTQPVELIYNENAAPHAITYDGEYLYLADQDRQLIILNSRLDAQFSGYLIPGFSYLIAIVGLLPIIIYKRPRN